MSSLAATRSALAAAIEAAGVRLDTPDPPSARIVLRGVTVGAGAVRGQSPATFGIVCLGGAWDSTAAADSLAALVGDVLTAIRALPGVGLGDVSGERILRVDGSDYIAAEVAASAMFDY